MGYAWEYTDDETGIVESSGWTKTEKTDGGTVKTTVFTTYDAEGEVFGAIQDKETKNKAGETTQESTTLQNADGSGQRTTKNADGTIVIETFDENGNITSTQYFDAMGNEVEPPKDSPGGFWDIDIIYGGPDGKYGTDDDNWLALSDMGAEEVMHSTAEMLVQNFGEAHAEAMMDQFDFFM